MLQYTNGMDTNLTEKRTIYLSAKNKTQAEISICSDSGNIGWRREVLSEKISKALWLKSC